MVQFFNNRPKSVTLIACSRHRQNVSICTEKKLDYPNASWRQSKVTLQFKGLTCVHVFVLSFGARSHFSSIACMFYNVSMFAQRCKKQQHQCVIYCMRCQTLVRENSGPISI